MKNFVKKIGNFILNFLYHLLPFYELIWLIYFLTEKEKLIQMIAFIACRTEGTTAAKSPYEDKRSVIG